MGGPVLGSGADTMMTGQASSTAPTFALLSHRSSAFCMRQRMVCSALTQHGPRMRDFAPKPIATQRGSMSWKTLFEPLQLR